MNIFKNTRKAKLDKLEKESILDFGKIATKLEQEQLKEADSISITANNRSILILLPYWEKEEMKAISERLINSEAFKKEAYKIFGENITLSTTESKALNFINSKECTSIAKKPQGQKKNNKGVRDIVALINGTDRLSIELALRICTTNEVMKCFFPDATDLSFERLD